ncbi:sulfate ABC transporter permease subunit CysT [Cohnella thailandensis]|jgi:sulfate ABC transporter, permease protein CysT|uniref:Sulfate transport system permease protein CysT n=1 Tax=Cohnella thailandensis TaxID=557557 RepID=A0A841SPZ8_9BACL|nr:sulfate ABC transporter permease subunit CysT [Cohnella thailandensis]MBB6632676.1 sulfate ABC transporter permease subunit CysT [Cohnella thailandensis]MBP1975634.1 sulfate transport system permease protein [Cohnella thailandensis]
MAKRKSVLPGRRLTLGFTILYLSLIVLIPLAGLVVKTAGLTLPQFWETVTSPRVLASYRVSLVTAFFAAVVNVVFGLIVAWVLVRYRFPGKKLVDGLIDIPFALPTAVAGIALTSIYAPNGWIGKLFDPLGIRIAYTPLGITLALIFIGVPFVVRTVQPVLQDLESDTEEASVLLGAYRWRTFRRVILPELIPPLLTGFALAFARGIGEYGSVVFISGNMPMKTEITPLLIITKLEQYEYSQATAIALVLLILSFGLLLIINSLQRWSNRRLRSS